MKAVVVLALLAVALMFIPEANGWRKIRRSRFGRVVRRILRKIRFRRIPGLPRVPWRVIPGKREVSDDLSDDDFLDNLSARDVRELVENDKITDADLIELFNTQRETRASHNAVEAEDSQEQH